MRRRSYATRNCSTKHWKNRLVVLFVGGVAYFHATKIVIIADYCQLSHFIRDSPTFWCSKKHFPTFWQSSPTFRLLCFLWAILPQIQNILHFLTESSTVLRSLSHFLVLIGWHLWFSLLIHPYWSQKELECTLNSVCGLYLHTTHCTIA